MHGASVEATAFPLPSHFLLSPFPFFSPPLPSLLPSPSLFFLSSSGIHLDCQLVPPFPVVLLAGGEIFVSDWSSEGTLTNKNMQTTKQKHKQRTPFEPHRFPALPSLILSMIMVRELHQNLELHLTETFTPSGLTMSASRQSREKEEWLDLLLSLF